MKSTVPILFNGGSYGTYLEWVLTALTNNQDIVAPFDDLGSSHDFKGHHLSNMGGWQQYLEQGHPYAFVRFHPKVTAVESLSVNLDKVFDQVDHGIYLYPDPDSVLLSVNNFYSKIWKDWWSKEFEMLAPRKIYDNWPEFKDVPIADIPIWVKREFLSFYLMPAWYDQVEWNHIETWQHKNCKVVTIKELLYNFESTIHAIGKFCNLTFTRDPKELLPFHNEMLARQTNLEQDQLCQQIIQAVVNCTEFTWRELPLPSQSWVQWQLRKLGLEIKCDGLDLFPTSSVQLENLTYPTHESI